ncbi:MAG: phosphotransferase [Bacteroidaceae bacterium]|nr:phosphotransferase [Bacteroidaceae bacterium]
MNLYKFHTFRTDYYFPDPIKGGDFLFGLYHPYNRFPLRLMMIKAYWWMYRHCKLVRSKCLVNNADMEFPYSKIVALCPKGSILSFNMGTPGPEQKISMLGLEQNGNHFFAKYSTKEAAKDLSRNEISVLKSLHGTGLAPELLDYKHSDGYVFFRTTCVEGSNPKSPEMNEHILNLLIRISKNGLRDGDLKTCISHGDFTPWNIILTTKSEYRMIDWEMAGERELGYDIFTYVTHVGALLTPDMSPLQLIEKHKLYVDKYFASFGIENWIPYMKAFAQRRIQYELSKGANERAKLYECML